ncbi:MAG: serine/threonine protein kinase [Lentisphaeria bacterium]|nr:serine/threonine protein kinase [Lentisphaeria bacterium]
MRFQCQNCMKMCVIDDSECGKPAGCGYCGFVNTVPESRFAKNALISDFVISSPLGTGGMGAVFLAHQVSLDRPVALKVLMQQHSNDSDYIQEFVKEARSAARLNHPNIVQSYAVGEDEGIYFFAMEYVKGETLKQLLQKEGKLKWENAVKIIRQIADALDFAWKQQQLVHRDIKPDNIMLSETGVAKLADLGLARHAKETTDDEEQVMGTPQYICPEQLLGKPMDVRGDIYSLGATLFHALVGRFPFDGQSANEIARKHVYEEVENVNELESDLPKGLGFIISKMMAKKLEDRYEDAEELVIDLNYILRDKLPVGYKGAVKGKTNRKNSKVGTKTSLKVKVDKTRQTQTGIGDVAAPSSSQSKTSTNLKSKSKTKVGGKSTVMMRKNKAKTSITATQQITDTNQEPLAPAPAPKTKSNKGLLFGCLGVIGFFCTLAIIVVVWFIQQQKKYDFKSTKDAYVFYVTNLVPPGQRAAFDNIQGYFPKPYEKGANSLTPEKGLALYRSINEFIDLYPSSLFVESEKNRNYLKIYQVPFEAQAFGQNIEKNVKGFEGVMTNWRGEAAEYVQRALRKEFHRDDLKRIEEAARAYRIREAKAAAREAISDLADERYEEYGEYVTEFGERVDGMEDILSEGKIEVRKEITNKAFDYAWQDLIIDLQNKRNENFVDPAVIRDAERVEGESETRGYEKQINEIMATANKEELIFSSETISGYFKKDLKELGFYDAKKELAGYLEKVEEYEGIRRKWFDTMVHLARDASNYDKLIYSVAIRALSSHSDTSSGQSLRVGPQLKGGYRIGDNFVKVKPYRLTPIPGRKSSDKIYLETISPDGFFNVSLKRYRVGSSQASLTVVGIDQIPKLEFIANGVVRELIEDGLGADKPERYDAMLAAYYFIFMPQFSEELIDAQEFDNQTSRLKEEYSEALDEWYENLIEKQISAMEDLPSNARYNRYRYMIGAAGDSASFSDNKDRIVEAVKQ